MRLFDTTYLIDLVNSNSGALRIARQVDEEGNFAALSVVSAHEYLFGVYYRYHMDEQKLAEKVYSATKDLARFEILPLTYEVVETSSKVQAHLERTGISLGINDIYIASTALHLKLKLVTKNLQHFRRIPDLEIEAY